jgi:hypothetical protein
MHPLHAPRLVRPALAIVALAFLPLACAPGSGAAAADDVTADSATWRPLLTSDLGSVWRGYRADSVPAGWQMVGDTLTKSKGTGDLITRDPYSDFELELDWKLTSGGNAGIFYRATEEYDHIYWSGPEYQLLDDAGHPDGKNRLTAAGSSYGIYPADTGAVKPAGEWSSSRIVVRGSHVEHWLNGTKLVDFELGSPDWTARVAKSKFSVWKDYGRARSGYIGIQGDHDGALSIRNMRVRPLD